MDADWYVVEQMIRDRRSAARSTARCAALLRRSNECLRRPNGIGNRRIDPGRWLVTQAREVAFKIFRALSSRKPATKRS
jgi:hypothetical protein